MNRRVLIVGSLIVVPLLVFLALSFGKDPRAIESPLIDAPAPGFALLDLDGLPVDMEQLRGQPVMINFWATWCQPCIRSLPKLVEMSNAMDSKGVKFVGISVDSPRNTSKVKPFASSMGITYPVLLDPSGELMGELSVMAVPTLIIVDRDLNIVYTHEGFNAGDELEIREEIEKYLASGI